MIAWTNLAQAVQNPEIWQTAWSSITQAGMGAILLSPIVYWFAMRLERILERNTQAIERNTISNMVSVLNTQRLDEGLRLMAERVKSEAENALQK